MRLTHKEFNQCVPGKEDYIAAFRHVEEKLPRNAKPILKFHYNSLEQTTTMTLLAQEMRYESYRVVNRWYGEIAKRVGEQLDKETDPYLSVLVDFISRGEVGNEHILLVMRPQVAVALKECGWV